MSEKEKKELFEFLKKIIQLHPNDQELGKEIRKYFVINKENRSINGVQ